MIVEWEFTERRIMHQRVYKTRVKQFCCDTLKSHTKGNYIGAGDYKLPSKSRYFNIYECKAYPEGVHYVSHKINYCPFCGEKIEYKEADQNT